MCYEWLDWLCHDERQRCSTTRCRVRIESPTMPPSRPARMRTGGNALLTLLGEMRTFSVTPNTFSGCHHRVRAGRAVMVAAVRPQGNTERIHGVLRALQTRRDGSAG